MFWFMLWKLFPLHSYKTLKTIDADTTWHFVTTVDNFLFQLFYVPNRELDTFFTKHLTYLLGGLDSFFQLKFLLQFIEHDNVRLQPFMFIFCPGIISKHLLLLAAIKIAFNRSMDYYFILCRNLP